ncbi:MAG: CpaF family protein [Bacillota bacterium]
MQLSPECDQTTRSATGDIAAVKKKELERLAVETLHRVIDEFGHAAALDKMDTAEKKLFADRISDSLNRLMAEQQCHLSMVDKQKVVQYVADEVFGFGPINALLEDPGVSEIMVNGYRQVYVERNGTLQKTEITFRDDAHVLHTIEKIVTPLGRRIDESSPMVDARLPDGSRVNAIISPLSIKGPALTIRKFATEAFGLEDLIALGALTHQIAHFLKMCVKGRLNIIVSGGTGSGKTTMLNILSGFISSAERIVTIEDAAELQLKQEHVVTLESRPPNNEGRGQITIHDLVRNSLRMRPDRIVVGEVRGGEALDMMQAMNTGHDGSISTLHANNPRDALARLETMILMAGMDLPHRAIREQISSAIDLIIQQSRYPDGSRKISKISEVVGMEGDTITLQDLFVFRQSGVNDKGKVIGSHVSTGLLPTFIEKLRVCGENISLDMFQLPAGMRRREGER